MEICAVEIIVICVITYGSKLSDSGIYYNKTSDKAATK
jgi:hypothetical protein